MQPGGQSLVDRLLAAKNTIAGQALAKVVCKATTEEIMGPKRKHLDCKLFMFISSLVFIYRFDDNVHDCHRSSTTSNK
jgi:hypothetical protein